MDISKIPLWLRVAGVAAALMFTSCMCCCGVGMIGSLVKPSSTEVVKKAENPTPEKEPPPTVITEDFFPNHVGRVMNYEIRSYVTHDTIVVRSVFKGNGGIETINVKTNEPHSLLGQYYRKTPNAIELGSKFSGDIVWRPVLKLGARVGDKWEWSNKDHVQTYKVLRFQDRDVVIDLAEVYRLSSFILVSQITYRQGVGMVRKETQFSPKGESRLIKSYTVELRE